MLDICNELKPTGCLECISGDMVGDMIDFLHFGGTMFLYGILSGEKATNINTGAMIQKNLTIKGYISNEAFIPPEQWKECSKQA